MKLSWETVDGTDLYDAYTRHDSLSELLPESPAIYLWRRVCHVPPQALRTSEDFLSWLDDFVQLPSAEIVGRRLSHFAVLDKMSIRSPGITPTKRHQFHELMRDEGPRRWLMHYLQVVDAFAPPLYCGETSDLANRAREHIGGETAFGSRIQSQELKDPWSHLQLSFLQIKVTYGPKDKRTRQFRELLELITTALSIAGYVSRRG